MKADKSMPVCIYFTKKRIDKTNKPLFQWKQITESGKMLINIVLRQPNDSPISLKLC